MNNSRNNNVNSGIDSTTFNRNENEKRKKAKKRKIKILFVLLPHIISILTLIIIVMVVILFVGEVFSKIIDGYEKTANFLTLRGFNTNIELIKKDIDQAANDCSDCLFQGTLNSYRGLDKEILYAAINTDVIVDPDLYSNADEGGDAEVDIGGNPIVDKLNSHAFYNMRENLLGTTSTPGTLIYNLIGTTIDVSCENEDDDGDAYASNNKTAIVKYLADGFLKSGSAILNVGAHIGMLFIPVIGEAEIIDIADNTLSYGSQDSNYIKTKLRALKYTLTESNTSKLSDALAAAETCKSQGKYAKFNSHRTNDYELFYKYIKYVYVPTLYDSVWSKYDSDRKEKRIRETWANIVNVRNASSSGENNYLHYTYDEDGEISAEIITSSYDPSYSSTFIVDSSLASAALTWKQGASAWGDKEYDKGYTMRNYGCLITSIAKLVALSGTKINSETFDPWVFAQSARYVSGGLYYNSWTSLVPNFKKVKSQNVFIDSNSNDPSAQLSGAINNTGLVGEQYYYVFYIEYYRGTQHHHYIPIVGSDANGLIVSDPAYGGDTYYLNDIKNKINNTVKIRTFQVYEKTD